MTPTHPGPGRVVRFALAAILAAGVVAGGPPPTAAHGDPPGHYLETDLLYPAFGDRPTQAVELALLGLLRASATAGYPIRVALIANETDVEDPEMLGRPQAYAEDIVASIEGERGTIVASPILVVAPDGFGVAGKARLDGGPLVPVTGASAARLVAGIARPASARGDALAAAATDAVRQIARLGGHPLPASVEPASAVFGPVAAATDPGMDWVPIAIFLLLFLPAWAAYELVRRQRTRDRSMDAAAEQPTELGPIA